MPSWLHDVGALLLAWTGVQVLLGAALGGSWQWERRLARAVLRRVRPAPHAVVVPLRRPIEQIGADVRRLHHTFHRGDMRFAKYEGCRLAYDDALAEAADSLEIDHLLAVLPTGHERDLERERLERVLGEVGMLSRPHAA